MLWRSAASSAGSASAGKTQTSGIGSIHSRSGTAVKTSSIVPTGPRSIGRTRFARSASASRQTRVAMRVIQVRSEARPSKRSSARQARTIVSCTASSASEAEPSIR